MVLTFASACLQVNGSILVHADFQFLMVWTSDLEVERRPLAFCASVSELVELLGIEFCKHGKSPAKQEKENSPENSTSSGPISGLVACLRPGGDPRLCDEKPSCSEANKPLYRVHVLVWMVGFGLE
ncbi:hypothetical protein RJ641_008249 [Dillenia turbinata]|uniref:Uncharacterized protein n=1 Tax=Dillenia turbinata TaxID=194707 RepID=A0AAN8V2X9_9MAGN